MTDFRNGVGSFVKCRYYSKCSTKIFHRGGARICDACKERRQPHPEALTLEQRIEALEGDVKLIIDFLITGVSVI